MAAFKVFPSILVFFLNFREAYYGQFEVLHLNACVVVKLYDWS